MPQLRRSPIWSDPRVKPPYGSVEIDWGHPLAQGLSALYLLNEAGGGRVVDTVGRWPGTTAGGAFWTPSPGGTAVSLDGTDDVINAGDIPFLNDSWTLATRVTLREAGTNRRFTSWDNGGPAIWIQDNNTTWGIVHAGSIDFAIATDAPQLNDRVFLTIARSNAATARIAKNGVVVGETTTFSATFTTSGNVFRIGSGFSNTENAGGVYEYTGAWGTRGFLAADILWLNAEPYAFLRPVIRRRFFVPAVAGAAGDAALHRRTVRSRLLPLPLATPITY